MTRTARRWGFVGCALVAVPGVARAAGETVPSAPTSAETRREVVLALGYGSIVAPRGIVVYRTTDTAERVAALDGLSLDIMRRFPLFEFGARFWRMDGSSDGKGASAHVLTRLSSEARFYPLGFGTVEPWVGVELGLALADDFALWSAVEKEPARRASAGVRPGLVAGLEAGGRLRLSSIIALGLRGGALFLGFDRAGGRSPIRLRRRNTSCSPPTTARGYGSRWRSRPS